MKIEEIIQAGRSPQDVINDLKKKTVTVPYWTDLKQQYEPILHKIMTDKVTYPDKPIKDEKGNVLRYEPVTRVCVGLQKLATKRMSEFMFTTPVNIVADVTENSAQKVQFEAIQKVLKKAKWNSINKKRCKINSSECEQATYWYVVPGDNQLYGFKSKFKLKCTVFSPSNGDDLYPLFDDTGDMIAFSRQFVRKDGNKEITYFETWTSDNYYRWKQVASGWEQDVTSQNVIGKIPIVYTYRAEPIWADADNGKVHELELLLSRNGDIIAYHASPVLIIKGRLQGAPTKGEANKVFMTEDASGGAEYVSWSQSPESVKFQFETLLRMFFTELQLPDLSFENIKGIGAVSGESRKWLLVDAHLKVGDECEIYEEMIEREFNVLKAYLGTMNTQWKDSINNLEIVPEIRPFIIADEKARVDVLVAANGGKPLISQETSVGLSGLVENANEEYLRIEAEYAKDTVSNVFEPTQV